MGERVEVHEDHFPEDARDEEWLIEVGRRGWIALSKDQKIRYRTPEVLAVQKARCRLFVLTPGSLHGREMAEVFIKALPAMKRFVLRTPSPFIANVTRRGSVRKIFP